MIRRFKYWAKVIDFKTPVIFLIKSNIKNKPIEMIEIFSFESIRMLTQIPDFDYAILGFRKKSK